MASIQAQAKRFFLNEDLWLENCHCSLDDKSLHLVEGEKSFNLALDNIAFTGYRKSQDNQPAAVILCQAGGGGGGGDMASEESERPEVFDDLVIEFTDGEDAMRFHKAIEAALSKATNNNLDPNGAALPSSSSSSGEEEEEEEEDLPIRMAREAEEALQNAG